MVFEHDALHRSLYGTLRERLGDHVMTWQKALRFRCGLAIGIAIGSATYQSISTGDIDWYRVVFVSSFFFCGVLLVPRKWLPKMFGLSLPEAG